MPTMLTIIRNVGGFGKARATYVTLPFDHALATPDPEEQRKFFVSTTNRRRRRRQ